MTPLQVLLVDDSEADALLILRELRRVGYAPDHLRVDTAESMLQALSVREWDIILCDHVMPDFGSAAALRLVQEKGLDVPVIIVSGQIGEDAAVAAMRSGAHDYIMKGNLKRLGPAIQRELAETVVRRERKKAAEMLRVKEEELRITRQMDAIKDEFIGMVSHELKTPLTVIIGALRVATTTRGLTEKQVDELLHDAVSSAEELASIVDNLLELSRYQSNRLNLSTNQTSVIPVVVSVVDRLRGRSEAHRLVLDLPDDLPFVEADPIRIERVINNLVENAIKYSPDGGEVTIFGHQEDNQLVIGVRDHGIGIPAEEQPRLFEKFQRLETDKKYQITGIGLGLRVCRILVEAHAGRIWLESTPGKGSTFCFSLPVSRAVRH